MSSSTTIYANTDLGYWLQTVAYFIAALGTSCAAIIGFVQLRALRIQIRSGELHSAEQINLLRQQLKASEDSSNKHIDALKAQMESDGRMARLRATVDIARLELTDKELLEAFEMFSKQREQGEVRMSELARTHPLPLGENSALLRVLNNYEYIAVAIRMGALDKDLYKGLKRSSVVRDWDAMKPYVRVLRLRYRRASIGIDLEKLANEWRDDQKQ